MSTGSARVPEQWWVDPVGPGPLLPQQRTTAPREDAPESMAGWKALVEGMLTNHCCAFHRNMEISARYVWMHQLRPHGLKWAAMAAFASHHVRLALSPLRLDTDGTGYVDIPRSLGRPKLLRLADVDTIRATNNAIFDDIFWVHLAYGTAEDGIGRLRVLLGPEPHYAPVLAAFEAIDRGRQVLEDTAASSRARQAAEDLVWAGTLQILEHEQRALVQPCFDRLSCAFARLVSIGATTSFEVRGMRQELAYFTSFYLHALTAARRPPSARGPGPGSPATRTVGAGSRRASSRGSGSWTLTRDCSTPASDGSPTRPATSLRSPASCRSRQPSGPEHGWSRVAERPTSAVSTVVVLTRQLPSGEKAGRRVPCARCEIPASCRGGSADDQDDPGNPADRPNDRRARERSVRGHNLVTGSACLTG